MPEPAVEPHAMTRITCMAHQLLEPAITACLQSLDLPTVLIETARGVRQRIRRRAWGLPGLVADLENSPMDVYRVAVPPASAGRIMNALIEAGELRTPGHGMLLAQNIQQYAVPDAPASLGNPEAVPGMLRDMVLMTCILSMTGSGEQLASTVLQLGVCVPVVSRGAGTGIRDRLGLLRITIPPEKDIVRLMIPAHDANGIGRLLIEEGRLDRPGGGFLYQTPIRECLMDPLLRFGRQGHAASMEQIIAALDDLKGGTVWRKRVDRMQARPEQAGDRMRQPFRELTFTCPEGQAERLVRAAMATGAGGATTSRVSRLHLDKGVSGGVAHEIGMLCVPRAAADAVVRGLCDAMAECQAPGCCVQSLDAPSVFTYQRQA